MSTHAPLAPSAAHLWSVCPQAAAMQALYPSEETDATREGTVAHKVLARVLMGLTVPGVIDDIQVDDEMLDGAELFKADVRSVAGDDWLDVEVGLRQAGKERGTLYVECATPAGIHADCWGTPDAYMWLDGTRLVLWDYKYGHRRVDAKGNPQALCYLHALTGGAAYPRTEVRIVQPRNYESGAPVRTWLAPMEEQNDGWAALKRAADRAMKKDRDAVPGDQCGDCSGRHACTPLQAEAMRLVQFADRAATVYDLPDHHAGRELAVLRKAEAMLAARSSGLEAQVTAAYRRGERRIGWALERSTGRQVWSVDAEAVRGLGLLAGVDLMKPPTPITPRQAITKGIPEAIVAGMAERKAGGEKLVPEDKTQARAAFFEEQ